jgi:acyl transferase domain-containing protein/acyl carrier protein
MMNEGNTSNYQNEIAVIGMTCRLPGARNIQEFWQNLCGGVESISFFPDQELLSAGADPAVLGDPNYVKASGVLQDIDLFDAGFFGFSPREAEITDPQHRIFLECAWESLEDAGYDPDKYQGRISVYAGVGPNTYLLSNLYPERDAIESAGHLATAVGNEKDHLATRISYKLNLRGPGISVSTACSTSLVAIHLACQSLLNGESDMSLAGGVSIRVPHKVGYLYQEGGIVSPDGHCRAFDAKAQGTVPGNGVGVVLLKRLADALTDEDYIHAIIKGSAINNDGSVKVGYTAPSVEGQAEVIADAHAIAGIEPETITFIETHGTGTSLGDPIEFTALAQVFRASTSKKAFCAIGSVKTNLGHVDAAAGVAGFIKTVLALKHKLLPPSLHFEQPNPKINFADSPFYFNTALSKWKANGTPRRAGVSSFGIGGTNAHVVLEEAPPPVSCRAERPWHLLVLSAKTNSALEAATTNLVEHLKQHADLDLADVAYTLQVGRRHFGCRRFLVCHDSDDAINGLEKLNPKRVFTALQEKETQDRPVVFLFPGQGSQYVNMAAEVYQAEPTFREQVDRCCELLKPYLGSDLRTVLYPTEEQVEEARQQLNQTCITQPALFVTEYALARLWMKWGAHPQAMIGHSIGEYVAACLAGVFSLEDALALVAARGRMMQQLPGGAMLAVPLAQEEIEPLLNIRLSLVAINSPSYCVVSGPIDAVNELEHQLTSRSVACRHLQTSHAFHSSMMDPIVGPFTEHVKKIVLKRPKIPFVSNVTGTWITPQEATDATYWARHLRQTVRFAEGLQVLLQDSERILLELGPGRTLSTLVRQHPDRSPNQLVLPSLRHPQEVDSDCVFLLNTCGRLWLAGVQIDWRAFYAEEHRHRLPLPTYPFERRRYWIDPLHNSRSTYKNADKKLDVNDWFYMPSWKRSLLPDGDQTQSAQCWLVFSDDCDVGFCLAKRLEGLGHSVITVLPGKHFARLSEQVYILDPRQPDTYASLLKELAIKDHYPQKIVHLWHVTPALISNDGISPQSEELESSQDLGFYSLLFLVQALGKQENIAPTSIWVVTNNMQDVAGEEMLYPEKATVLGPCKVIPQEYPHLSCCSVDIVLPEADGWQKQRLIDQLIDEFAVRPSDAVIAYRGDHRWVQTFEAVRLAKKAGPVFRLRERGVYLVAGGLGATGLRLAEYLARDVRAKLVLVDASVFPERAEWARWLDTHEHQDKVSQKIRNLQALGELGAEVLVVRADVSNQEQMRKVLTQVYERFGVIHGVIHAAGIVSGRIIQMKTREDAEQTLAPKVKGALVLAELFKDAQLDFLVLCSSLASVLGSSGQVDYCGANAFLDAFAQWYTPRSGTYTVSINWDTWQEVNQAADRQVPLGPRKAQAGSSAPGISLEGGHDAFRRILGSKLRRVLVSTGNFYDRVERSAQESCPNELEHSLSSRSLHSRPELATAYIAPRNEIEQILVTIWQEIFGIDQIGVFDDFYQVGGDSLLATKLASRACRTFQLEIPLARILELHTIAGLAELIEEMLIKKVEELSEEEVQRLTETMFQHQ